MLTSAKSRDEVLELARQNGLAIDGGSLQFNESGLDFQVVLATDASGHRWVLRLPRREDVLSSVAKEKRTLDLVAPYLSVEVPRWVVCTNDLIGYRALPGVPAATIDPEAKAYVWQMDAANVPDSFHSTLAKGLVSLHQIGIAEVQGAGLPIKTIDDVRAEMKQRMDTVRTQFGVSSGLWKRWQAWLSDDASWPIETALTHGDLHAGHILIDTQSRVTGLIDWTEAGVADPARDFVAHSRVFGEDALRALIAAYAEAGGAVWRGMAEHVIQLQATFPLDVAEFACRSGLDEYKQMAVNCLHEGEANCPTPRRC